MVTTTLINGTTYTLTFGEDFDDLSAFQGHGSDGIWTTSFSPHLEDGRFLGSNGEGQYYVDPDDVELPNPFAINDGILSITATELDAAQSAAADDQGFSSGIITTEMSFSAEYGYLEIGANVPDQQGFLSSLWLLPADGDWSSEIDVFETLGHLPATMNTNHWANGTPDQLSFGTVDMSDGFHTYGLEWTAYTLTWFIDGQEVRTDNNTSTHEEMFLAVSLAVDTNWTGAVDATTDFTDPFEIDYIHFYEDQNNVSNAPVENGETVDEFFVYGQGDGAETLFGTKWGDDFSGAGDKDIMFGRDGDDTVDGGDGRDTLFGQNGQDIVKGSDGNDKLIGGRDGDRLEGGTGTDHIWGGTWGADGDADTIVFAAGDGKDFVHDFEAGIDQIDVSALGTDWATLSEHIHDQGWATYIDIASISGVAGDKMYLIGVDTDNLSADNFVLDFGA